MDSTDIGILRALGENCRASYQEMGRSLGMTANAIKKRVKKLVDNGTIHSFVVYLSFAMIDAESFLAILTPDGINKEEEILAQIVEQPYHDITPGYGYLWWISPEFGFYCAQGRFGQQIFIIPEYNIVLAFTCHINDWLIQPWDYFIEKFIIPAVLENNTQTSTSTETSETTDLPIYSILLFSTVGIAVIIIAWKQQSLRRSFKQSNYCSINPNCAVRHFNLNYNISII